MSPNPAARPKLRLAFWKEEQSLTFDCAFASNLKITRWCPQPGIVSESIELLLRLAKIDFELFDARHASWGQLLETVYNGTADALAISAYVSAERLEKANFSHPISAWSEHMYVMGTSRHSMDFVHRALSFVLVYDVWIWLTFIGIMMLSRAYKKALKYIAPNRQKQNSGPQSQAFQALIVSFFTMLFIGLYRSGILSGLLTAKHVYQFDNIDKLLELLEHNELKLISTKMAWFDSEQRDMKRLLRTFDYNPSIYLPNGLPSDYKQEIQDGNAAFLYSDNNILNLLSQWCGVRAVSMPTLGYMRAAFFFNKDVPGTLIARINRAIIESQAGLDAIKARYSESLARKFKHCVDPPEPIRGRTSIDIGNAIGIILLLGIGLTLASICFAIEFLCKCYKSRADKPSEIDLKDSE